MVKSASTLSITLDAVILMMKIPFIAQKVIRGTTAKVSFTQ